MRVCGGGGRISCSGDFVMSLARVTGMDASEGRGACLFINGRVD